MYKNRSANNAFSLAAAIASLWTSLLGTTSADDRAENFTSWALADGVEELELAFSKVALALVESAGKVSAWSSNRIRDDELTFHTRAGL